MSKSMKILVGILAVVVVAGLLFFAAQYVMLSKQLQTARNTIAAQQVNKKILSFSKLFVANVLQGGQSISFDQRLQLENAVRDINDQEIYGAWQKFTNAKDQAAIQQDFYNLFNILLKKMAV